MPVLTKIKACNYNCSDAKTNDKCRFAKKRGHSYLQLTIASANYEPDLFIEALDDDF